MSRQPHLRPIRVVYCAWPGCDRPATETLMLNDQDPSGDYCSTHAEQALTRTLRRQCVNCVRAVFKRIREEGYTADEFEWIEQGRGRVHAYGVSAAWDYSMCGVVTRGKGRTRSWST